MAKAHELNIYGYLKFLLEHRPDKDMTGEQLAELPPWSEKLQCYQKSHVNYSELLQLAKGWGNFVSDSINIWHFPY